MSGGRQQARAFAGLLMLLALAGSAQGGGVNHAGGTVQLTVTNSPEVVVAYVHDLDLLRQAGGGLRGEFQLLPGGSVHHVDLSATCQPPAVVIAKPERAACTKLRARISRDGKVLHDTEHPLGQPVESRPGIPLLNHKATIEPGSWKETEPVAELEQLAGLPSPRGRGSAPVTPPEILLPDLSQLPKMTLRKADRVIDLATITWPVVCDVNYPLLGSGNIALSRQTARPADAAARSIYLSLKAQLYNQETRAPGKWVKFLVEIPLDAAWLEGEGDRAVILGPGEFRIHTTDKKYGKENILGEGMGGLAQLVHSMAVDENGNIYYSGVPGGLVRFNVHKGEFESPPVDFPRAIAAFLPKAEDIPPEVREGLKPAFSWGGYYVIAASRGRIFYAPVMSTRQGNRFEFNGVISLPTAHWDNAEKFSAALRLNVASWPSHPHSLYDSHPKPGDTTRKLGALTPTATGVIINAYIGSWGGPWRLDVDEEGNTLAFGLAKSFPDKPAPVPGPPWEAGPHLESEYGTCTFTRANLHYLLTGQRRPELKGSVTVTYDVVGKIRAEAERFGDLARSLGGPSLAPAWMAMEIPGESDKVLGAAEYGYYLAAFDLGTIREGFVRKTYLKRDVGATECELPLALGLGPYDYEWVAHEDAWYLYVGGYTGLTRMCYSRGGRPLGRYRMESLTNRLAQVALDKRPLGGIKWYQSLIPGLDGRIFITGTHTPSRGGGAFSGGLMSFSTRSLDKLERLAYMTRCFDTTNLRSRVVHRADGTPVQEFFLAGTFEPEYARRLRGEMLPVNEEPKMFLYEYAVQGTMRDLYGFSLPPAADGKVSYGDHELSRDRRFLILLLGANLLTFDLARSRFVDGVTLEYEGGKVYATYFARPSCRLLRAPDDRLFIYATPNDKANFATFFQVEVSPEGRLALSPFLTLTAKDAATMNLTYRTVYAFVTDLRRGDGSYDLLLGRPWRESGTDVRVIPDFIPPRVVADL